VNEEKQVTHTNTQQEQHHTTHDTTTTTHTHTHKRTQNEQRRNDRLIVEVFWDIPPVSLYRVNSGLLLLVTDSAEAHRSHVPLDCPPGPGPPSGASLGGPTMGQIGWGGPSTGPTLFFAAAGVSSVFRCEPLRAGCCGGGGVRGVS